MTPEEREKYGIEVTEKFTTPSIVPAVKLPLLDPKSKVYKHLTNAAWNSFKYQKTVFGNLATTLFGHEGAAEGIYAPDPDAYNKFATFLTPLIEDINSKRNNSAMPYEKTDAFAQELTGVSKILSLGHELTLKDSILLIKIKRNLKGYPFLKFCNVKQSEEIESKIRQVLEELGFNLTEIHHDKLGPINNHSALADIISFEHRRTSIPNSSELSIKVYVSKTHQDIGFTINKNHHLEAFHLSALSKIEGSVKGLEEVYLKLEQSLSFEHNTTLGFLGPELNSLGSGSEIYVAFNASAEQAQTINDNLSKLNEDFIYALIPNVVPDLFLLGGSNRVGSSLATMSFHLINKLHFVDNVLNNKFVEKLSLKNEGLTNINSKSIISSYESSFEVLKSNLLSSNINLNGLVTSLLKSNEIPQLAYFRYFYKYFLTYFENFIDNQADLQKNYFYKYASEKVDFIRPCKLGEERINSVVKEFNLELHRLVKGTISKEYISNLLNNVDTLGEKQKAALKMISHEILEFDDPSVSSKVTELRFSINSCSSLKEALTLLYDRTKIIFSAIEADFVTDNILGYLTHDLSTVGTGAKIRAKLHLKNVEQLEKNRVKLGISYIATEIKDEYLVEFNSFGKFICKLASNFLGFIEEIEIENEKIKDDEQSQLIIASPHPKADEHEKSLEVQHESEKTNENLKNNDQDAAKELEHENNQNVDVDEVIDVNNEDEVEIKAEN